MVYVIGSVIHNHALSGHVIKTTKQFAEYTDR